MRTFFEDLAVYREGLLAQGFGALQIYRFGHERYRFSSPIIRWPWAILHTLLGAPILRKRAQIWDGAKLLGAIRIGDDVLIGDNAVVICDVPNDHIAVGVPAVIKARGR